MKKDRQITYNELSELFDETAAELSYALKQNMELENEQRFLKGFISFKRLTDEYEYFKEHAHPAEDPDDPFPPLIL